MIPLTSALPPSQLAPQNNRTAILREAAVELEAAFLAEMLKSAGLGKSRSEFGGGAGEDQFGTFLVREQAKIIAKNGGIGLADSFFKSLMEAQNDI